METIYQLDKMTETIGKRAIKKRIHVKKSSGPRGAVCTQFNGS